MHICGGESERQRGQVKQTFHMPCPGICKWGDLLAKKKKVEILGILFNETM